MVHFGKFLGKLILDASAQAADILHSAILAS